MGSPHRQSGFTNFTLERPAAFVRRAQVVIVQRTEPWFARVEGRLLQIAIWCEHAGAQIVDTFRRSVMHTQATLRESVLPSFERAQRASVEAIARGTQRTRAAVTDGVAPRLAAVRAGASQATVRALMWAEDTRVHTVVPWLARVRQGMSETTIRALMWAQTTFDHTFVPWAIQTRTDLRERFQSSDDVIAVLKARLDAGVPLWLTAILMVVTALLTQAVTYQNADRRHEVTSRQLAQVFKAEQATADTRARETLLRESDEVYRMFGAVMAFTMHNALTRKSYDELDQYLNEIGKSERVKLAVLADLNGRIVAATDQTLKGTAFGAHFPPALLNEAVLAVQPVEGGLSRLVMPVERYSVRLGTAVLVYAPQRLSSN